MGRMFNRVMALAAVLPLLLVAACAPAGGEITPSPAPAPESTPTAETTPAPGAVPGGNFRFLISDEANAIGEFESLTITISSIGVHRGGESGEWLELPPAVEEVDLVPLQGEKAQEIWSGNLTDGQYTKVFIYVTGVSGILEDGETVDNIKLPSEKLQLNINFSLPGDAPVSFVFDVSVVAAGNEKSGIKYILKPVISESGPEQKFTEVTPEETEEEEQEQEGEEEAEDSASPVITLTGVTDGQEIVSPETVTPVFSASDDTDPEPTLTATLNGEPFESDTEIVEPGEYELEITATDASGNEAEVEVSFEIVPAGG